MAGPKSGGLLGLLSRLLALLERLRLGVLLLSLDLVAQRLEGLGCTLLLRLTLLLETVASGKYPGQLFSKSDRLVADAPELVEVNSSDLHSRVVPARALRKLPQAK
jgi:hypothetical protein